MDAAVAPRGILPCQAQYQASDRAQGPRSAGALGPRLGRVAAREQAPMPAQHRFRTYRQLKLTERSQREPVQQRREERPIGEEEPQWSFAQLAFQHGDLVL